MSDTRGPVKQVLLNIDKLWQWDRGVYQRFPQAEKVPITGLGPGGPGSWDARMTSIYGTVLVEDGKFHMWYTAMPDAQSYDENADVMVACYAESDDGYNWHKPDLKLTGQNRFPGNNLLQFPGAVLSVVPALPGTDAKYLAAAMLNEGMTSAIPDVCDDGRYRYITGTWIMASDDGLTWRQYSDSPVVCHGDVAVLFADHASGRYLLYNKFGAQHGLHHRRSFMGLESTDAIHWEGYNGDALKSRYCFMADDYDDLIATQRGFMITDYYGLGIHRTGDLYVAAESMFHMSLPLNMRSGQNADGLGYVRLGYSNDGMHWRHPKGRPGWLEYGKPGEFDAGFIVTANTFTEHGDDLLMYYGGSRDFHGWCINEQFQMRPDIPLEEQQDMCRIGAVARIKRDRFASLSCTWRGSFVVESTAPVGQDDLFINALCGQGGSVRVAIYDSDGVELKGNNRWDFKPLPGFGLDDCVPVTGDVMRAPIRFRNNHIGNLPAGKPVFLQFELFRSEVFAFEWDAEKS